MKIAIVGGGAAGFFAALAAKEANPEAEVTLFERSAKLLSKVKISGGGRCNVTHSCFDPKLLIQNYPRGSRELLGPFHRFQPSDTVDWFQSRGVKLKTEADGRMFPVTNSSSTIIMCLLSEAERLGVKILTQRKIQSIRKSGAGFELDLGKDEPVLADRVILATGSSPAGWEFAKSLGHSIQSPVPSLFTFNVPAFSLVKLSGVSVSHAKLRLEESRLDQEGPLLVTHWGFSGPAALKLSAFAARFLAERKYSATLVIDWLPDHSEDQIRQLIEAERHATPSKQLSTLKLFSIPKSLWKELCDRAGVTRTLSSLGKAALNKLCSTLKADRYQVSGKTTNKEEFVTCGGVTLSEIQFKTMQSKCCENLFLCGEVMDVDGVTGGFNFQNAWTTGWIAGKAAAS